MQHEHEGKVGDHPAGRGPERIEDKSASGKGGESMIYRTDDPHADFYKHDRELELELERMPECYECGRYIDDDYCYEINDELICESCLNRGYRKQTSDYME